MFALADCRSFYASCEMIFRADLRLHRKVAVASSNDGALIALTEEAKSIGVKKFEPYFKQKALCEKHNVSVFSANFQLYGIVSQRIMATIAASVPGHECYSIDEAFCDYTGIPNPLEFSHELRKRIWREQRIPIGISIGKTKTLAKLGQVATKKIASINGVCLLQHTHQRDWLAKRLPVNEVWGIGRATAGKLNGVGVMSVYDFIALPVSTARAIGGIVLERSWRELHGEPCIALEDTPPPKQQIIHSRSFGERLDDYSAISEALADFIVAAAEKLRAEDAYCGRISVFIQTSRFDPVPLGDGFSETIPGGTGAPRTLIKIGLRILQRLFKPGVRYAKAGVVFTDIRPRGIWQRDLFTPHHETEDRGVVEVMDAINARFGRKTVRLAAQGIQARHQAKAAMLSKNYLSEWSDIPIIRV